MSASLITRRQFVLGTAGLLALPIAGVLHAPPLARAAGTYTTTTSLRMRSGPGLSYDVVRILPAGAYVEIVDWAGAADGYTWAKVWAYSVLGGYVATEYLVPFSEQVIFPQGSTVRVDTASGGSANMRSGPGLSNAVLVVVANGTTGIADGVESVADGYTWARVTMLGTRGWMATSLLATGTGAQPPSGADFPVGAAAHVTCDWLKLRTAPSLNAGVYTLLPRGTTVTVTGAPVSADGYVWYPVASPGIGWVAGDYLASGSGTVSTFPVPSAVETTTSLNLRAQGGLDASVIMVLPAGTPLTTVSAPYPKDGFTWYGVRTESREVGFAAGEYLRYR
jgi:N-acetylmuramoyl-L-alanine amidase